MRIRIKDIPPEGLDIREEMSLDSINARMGEARENDIIFTSAPITELHLIPVPGGSEVSGSVSAKLTRPCPKCLAEVTIELEEKITISLKHKPVEKPGSKAKRGHVSNEERQWDDDIGVIFYEGEHVDLEDFLQETLILAINPFETPHDDCPGFESAEESSPKGLNLGEKLSEAMKKRNGNGPAS